MGYSEIEKLERELKEAKEKQKNKEQNCDHNWEPTKYDPDTIQEFIMTGYEGLGVDKWPTGYYIDEKRDRWSRHCKKCDKTEHTYEQAPVKYEPKFK